MPMWGFSGSGLVLGDKLILDAGRTIALDKMTGELLWKTKDYRPGYGSASVMQHDGRELAVVLNNDCLLVLDPRDGGLVAEYPWVTDFATSSTTPIISGNTIFISTGYNRGCTLLELKGNQLEPLYENKHMRNHMNTCVLWQGAIYGFDGNSHSRRLVNLVCIDHKSGETKWTVKQLGCGSLMLADGKLLVLSDEGELLVADASAEKFEPSARAKVLEGRCWIVPVLSHAKVYCRNAEGDLVCVDVSR